MHTSLLILPPLERDPMAHKQLLQNTRTRPPAVPFPRQTLHILLKPLLMLQLALPTLPRRKGVLTSLPLDLFTLRRVGTRGRRLVPCKLVVVLVSVQPVSVAFKGLRASTLA